MQWLLLELMEKLITLTEKESPIMKQYLTRSCRVKIAEKEKNDFTTAIAKQNTEP